MQRSISIHLSKSIHLSIDTSVPSLYPSSISNDLSTHLSLSIFLYTSILIYPYIGTISLSFNPYPSIFLYASIQIHLSISIVQFCTLSIFLSLSFYPCPSIYAMPPSFHLSPSLPPSIPCPSLCLQVMGWHRRAEEVRLQDMRRGRELETQREEILYLKGRGEGRERALRTLEEELVTERTVRHAHPHTQAHEHTHAHAHTHNRHAFDPTLCLS